MSCDDCSKGYILPGEPTGKIVDAAYFAASPEGTTSRAVVLLTDAFGLPLKNCKIMADDLAKRLACDVWVPDLFNGEPILAVDALDDIMPDHAGVRLSFGQKLRLVGRIIPRIRVLYRNRPPVASARVATFIKKLKEDKKYDKIGAVGYCFGGSCAIILGSDTIVDSVVICHPGNCTIEQIKAIKVPSSWACAEDDMSFGPKLRRQAEESFVARKGKEGSVDYEFKDYKGTAHGFAARPNLSIPEVKAGFEGSFEQTVNWFNKTLPV